MHRTRLLVSVSALMALRSADTRSLTYSTPALQRHENCTRRAVQTSVTGHPNGCGRLVKHTFTSHRSNGCTHGATHTPLVISSHLSLRVSSSAHRDTHCRTRPASLSIINTARTRHLNGAVAAVLARLPSTHLPARALRPPARRAQSVKTAARCA